jgi:alginate O-acetyltransferase complex protein AlgI
MIFNSISFVIFFSIIFFVYYFILDGRTKLQNWLLLITSYFFYGFADLKVLSLLIGATLIFFFLGKIIGYESNSSKSSWYTKTGVFIGVGMLVYFKYMNFFIESIASLFNTIGLRANFGTFNIIMPLGISFFTFKLISYIIDINRGKIEPAEDLVAFSTYVAFFPTILSGPIDRPHSFIPQLLNKRVFDYSLAVDGCRQILWGLFQKLVIADNLAIYTNKVWANVSEYSGSALLIVAVFYSFQLYTDFSGYSHMAIGIGKLLGFKITANFNYPFFTRNIAEYWRNWHMSLTSWLTDYVFMPLNVKFRNYGKIGIGLSIIFTMTLIGLWHGPNWTFVVFGIYHGLLYIPLIYFGKIFKKSKKLSVNKAGLPSFADSSKMVGTFMLVTFGLIIFRADNLTQSTTYISKILTRSSFTFPDNVFGIEGLLAMIITIIFVIIEWNGRNLDYAFEMIDAISNRAFRWCIYGLLLYLVGTSLGKPVQFIYFQF